jgi:hypothetical protein
MPRDRSPLEVAAGKLITAIQQEWHAELGETCATASEEVMHTAHLLLQAAKECDSIASVIGNSSVSAFLGEQWVSEHPKVWPQIQALEAAASGKPVKNN